MPRQAIRALLPLLLLVGLAGCGGRQAVGRSDPAAGSPTTGGPSASALATRSAPRSRLAAAQALVTDEAQNRLVVVDLASGRIARRVALPPDPEDIATMGNGGVVIVVSSRAGVITVLDRDTLRPIKKFGGFDEPHIAAISPDGQYAYVTDDVRGTLTVIRLSDMRVTSTIQVGVGAHHLAFSPDERQVWVALGERAQTITILSTVAHTPPLPSPELDPGHPHVVGHFRPGFPAHDLSFSPNGRQIWITSAAGPNVTAFAVRNRRALFRVPVGAPPQHIAFDGRFAYLTSGYADAIEKVAASSGRVITRAAAPYGSFELAAADGFVSAVSLLRGTIAIFTPALKRLRVVRVAPATREVAISRP